MDLKYGWYRPRTENRVNWAEHVGRINREIFSKLVLIYRPIRNRNPREEISSAIPPCFTLPEHVKDPDRKRMMTMMKFYHSTPKEKIALSFLFCDTRISITISFDNIKTKVRKLILSNVDKLNDKVRMTLLLAQWISVWASECVRVCMHYNNVCRPIK